jgi:hypothetical protein
MGEPFLPWWLVLLLGMWATALTLWRHPSVSRELCWWSGLATLIYSALILLALIPGIPSNVSPGSSASETHSLVRWSLMPGFAVILAASIWIAGRTTTGSRRLCYVILTITNAGICALLGSPEIAFGLAFVGLFSLRARWLRELQPSSADGRQRLKQTFELGLPETTTTRSDESWISGLLSLVGACLLIGTLACALRIETSRVTSSTRYSTLPTQLIQDRLQSTVDERDQKKSALQLSAGNRGDILVLLAVIAFISLAAARSELSETSPASDPAMNDASVNSY